MVSSHWRPRHVLLAFPNSQLRGLDDYMRARRPELEVRVRPLAAIADDDLAWAEVYVAFRPPPTGLQGGSVQWVHSTGAGVDAFLYPSPIPDHVLLTRTSEPFGPRIAEYCVSRALAATQEILALAEAQRERRWDPRRPAVLRGSRVLVVGTGELGSAIGAAFAALGCEVHGVSRSGEPHAPFESVRRVTELRDAVREAEWIVLAAPLTAATHRLVDRRVLDECRGAFLINVGRGALLDDAALLDALDAGRLRGAALDVFETEPLPADSPLWERRDVMISPHVSGLSTVEGAGESFLECLAQLERGEVPRYAIDRTRGY